MAIENAADIQPNEYACRCCGSTAITWVEHYGPTGVIAPDVSAEYRNQAGLRCFDCAAIER
ncbi:MAG: hypothetical protein ABI759_03235 [Candidatus Solibacter sp.]